MYDIFEKFSDGSSLWRVSVLELELAYTELHELEAESENQFYAIDIEEGEVICLDFERVRFDLIGLQSSLQIDDAKGDSTARRQAA